MQSINELKSGQIYKVCDFGKMEFQKVVSVSSKVLLMKNSDGEDYYTELKYLEPVRE